MKKELLRKQMEDLIRTRHMAYSTETSYLDWFDRYARFIEVHREGTSADKFGAFLTSLAHAGVSASTQNQAFAAILFLYREVLKQDLGKIDSLRARKRIHERVAPTVAEVRKIFEHIQDISGYPTRLIAMLLYGTGLRINEVLSIRIKDLQLADSRVVVRDPKHGHDRIVALPCALIGPIRKQMERAKLKWEDDQVKKLPVKLPGLLGKKYPSAGMSWNWYWLFPQHEPCVDKRSGQTVRWHCMDFNVQRAVRYAVKKAGLEMITPHNLRHAYATHAKDNGQDIRAIQQSLGHKSLETTMIYIHADATSVKSPLDHMLATA